MLPTKKLILKALTGLEIKLKQGEKKVQTIQNEMEQALKEEAQERARVEKENEARAKKELEEEKRKQQEARILELRDQELATVVRS